MVVDTSIVFKWLRNGSEPDRDLAINILNEQQKKEIEIVIPEFLYLEIANILATKTTIKTKDLKTALDILFSIDLNVYKASEVEIQEAAVLAKNYDTTAYDMLFVVIAKKLKTVLITADSKFVSLTKFSHVKLLSNVK